MTVPADAPILTADAMRAAEAACAAAGVSLSELMERAGAAVADVAWRMAAGAPVLILCGPGNNGGDGYVAARLLKARGATIRVAALAPPATDLA
ncbi:MAG: NAD(P)H-hydrate epimerase, partial [Sphingopyxis granuli]